MKNEYFLWSKYKGVILYSLGGVFLMGTFLYGFFELESIPQTQELENKNSENLQKVGEKSDILSGYEEEDDINAFKKALLELSGTASLTPVAPEGEPPKNQEKKGTKKTQKTTPPPQLSEENDTYSKQVEATNTILRNTSGSSQNDVTIQESIINLKNKISETKNQADSYISDARLILSKEQGALKQAKKDLDSILKSQNKIIADTSQEAKLKLSQTIPTMEKVFQNIDLLIGISDNAKNYNDNFEDSLGLLNPNSKINLEKNYAISYNIFTTLKSKQSLETASTSSLIDYSLKALSSLHITLENTLNVLKNTQASQYFTQYSIDSYILRIEKDIGILNNKKQELAIIGQELTSAKLTLESKTIKQNTLINSLEGHIILTRANIDIIKERAIKVLENLTRQYLELQRKSR